MISEMSKEPSFISLSQECGDTRTLTVSVVLNNQINKNINFLKIFLS